MDRYLLWGSKKATVLAASLFFLLIASVLKRVGVEVTATEEELFVALVGLYLGAQGVADAGKSAKLVEYGGDGAPPDPAPTKPDSTTITG